MEYASPEHRAALAEQFLRKPSAEETAMVIASAVRNHMEDFHVEHLSDEQMKELNPIIRNAILSALMAIEEKDLSH